MKETDAGYVEEDTTVEYFYRDPEEDEYEETLRVLDRFLP